MHLPNPVIRSHYRNGFIKQYVRDHLILRTEAATNNVTDYGVNKAVEHLPALRDKLSAIDDNYLDVQQDILETFVDRGQLQQLAKPTVTPDRQTHPGPQARSPPTIGSDARSGALRPNPGRQHLQHRRTPSARRRPPWAAPSSSTAWPPCATTSPSSAPRALSRSCPARAATDCRPRDIRSA